MVKLFDFVRESNMTFILQPWQLFFLALSGLVNGYQHYPGLFSVPFKGLLILVGANPTRQLVAPGGITWSGSRR